MTVALNDGGEETITAKNIMSLGISKYLQMQAASPLLSEVGIFHRLSQKKKNRRSAFRRLATGSEIIEKLPFVEVDEEQIVSSTGALALSLGGKVGCKAFYVVKPQL